MARRADFDVWCDKFQPETISGEDSPRLYETYGDDLQHICHVADYNHSRLWTLLDCDGKLYLSPGFHIVNRINYVVCKNPWVEGTRDYKY